MNYIECLMDRAANSDKFDNTEISGSGSEQVIPVPPRKVYAVFSSEKENADFIIGDDNGLYSETLCVRVITAENEGSQKCKAEARKICLDLLELDLEKRIISVAAGECKYNEDYLAYEMCIHFGMRTERRYGGEQD